MRLCIACFLIVCAPVIYGNTSISDAYISMYKDIAIFEMKRTGIPASIKLAQGLLESDWGRSKLAREANNHFGMKCGSLWEGNTYYKEDDDRDKRGKLIKSCFRVFNDAVDSYIAHSDFLTRSGRDGRYGFLFDLDPTDYEAWAHGLRKAGYATDPAYPQKLIKVIKKYKLDRFDVEAIEEEAVIVSHHPSRSENRLKPSRLDASEASSEEDLSEAVVRKPRIKKRISYKSHKTNGVKHVIARGGETIADVAASIGRDVSELLEYNEGITYSEQSLDKLDKIFISKKKRSFKGKTRYHEVLPGESMYDISQRYGIKLVNLYAKNKMPKSSEPLPGEKIYLKKTVSRKDRPTYVKIDDLTKDPVEEYLFVDDPHIK